ncbi:MAG: hypothetical protein M1820_007627, partial [Bogoriella megaspora]
MASYKVVLEVKAIEIEKHFSTQTSRFETRKSFSRWDNKMVAALRSYKDDVARARDIFHEGPVRVKLIVLERDESTSANTGDWLSEDETAFDFDINQADRLLSEADRLQKEKHHAGTVRVPICVGDNGSPVTLAPATTLMYARDARASSAKPIQASTADIKAESDSEQKGNFLVTKASSPASCKPALSKTPTEPDSNPDLRMRYLINQGTSYGHSTNSPRRDFPKFDHEADTNLTTANYPVSPMRSHSTIENEFPSQTKANNTGKVPSSARLQREGRMERYASTTSAASALPTIDPSPRSGIPYAGTMLALNELAGRTNDEAYRIAGGQTTILETLCKLNFLLTHKVELNGIRLYAPGTVNERLFNSHHVAWYNNWKRDVRRNVVETYEFVRDHDGFNFMAATHDDTRRDMLSQRWRTNVKERAKAMWQPIADEIDWDMIYETPKYVQGEDLRVMKAW